nr:MAG TPA: hypothetical protein [Caudoviricetes sp.]
MPPCLSAVYLRLLMKDRVSDLFQSHDYREPL